MADEVKIRQTEFKVRSAVSVDYQTPLVLMTFDDERALCCPTEHARIIARAILEAADRSDREFAEHNVSDASATEPPRS